jgi:predicted transcriptional regulator
MALSDMSKEQMSYLRALMRLGVRQVRIANIFGIHQTQVSVIANSGALEASPSTDIEREAAEIAARVEALTQRVSVLAKAANEGFDSAIEYALRQVRG